MLEVVCLNVGHGDCLVVTLPGNRVGIIDSNTFGSSHKPLRSLLENRFESGRLDSVEFICVSHPHIDHYRGLAETLKWLNHRGVRIVKFYDCGASGVKAIAILRLAAKGVESKEGAIELVRLEALLRDLEPKGTIYEPLSSPRQLLENGDVRVIAHAPLGRMSTDYHSFLKISDADSRRRYCKKCPGVHDDNFISSVLEIKYGDFHFLSCGDVPNVVWRELFSRNDFRRFSVVKMSHHGSPEGNTLESGKSVFENFAKDGNRTAIISGGYRYGLPFPETVKALADSGWNVYCTGPICRARPRPYIPQHLPPGDKEAFLSHQVAFVEPAPVKGVGSGNIEIKASVSGEYTVKPEFP